MKMRDEIHYHCMDGLLCCTSWHCGRHVLDIPQRVRSVPMAMASPSPESALEYYKCYDFVWFCTTELL
jgi:hypothetical protein